jgi:hypothetical protein
MSNKNFNFTGMKLMLKFIVFILICLVTHETKAQVFIKPNNSYGLEYNRIKLDTAAVIPSDTVVNKITGSIAILNGVFYIKNLYSWDALALGGSGGSTGSPLTWENVLDNGSDFSHSHLSNGNTNDLYFNNYGVFTINSDQFAVPYLGGGDATAQFLTTDAAGNFELKALPISVDSSGTTFGNQDLQDVIDQGNRLRHNNTIHSVGHDFYIDSLGNYSTFSGKTATFDNQTGAYTEIHQDSANAYLYSQSYTGLNISEVRTHQDSAHFQSYDSLGHNARFTAFGKGTLNSYASIADSLNSPKIVFGDANYKNSDITQVLTTNSNGDLTFTSGGGVTGDITWSVLSILNTPPGSPVTGDTYLAGTSPTGGWVANTIEVWNGSAWVSSSATTGDLLQNDNNSIVYKFNGTSWVQVGKAPWLIGLNAGVTSPKLGTSNNTGMGIYTNNTQRLGIGNAGAFTFNSLSGTGTVLMGLSSTGLASRITLGTNLSLSGSTLNASGGGGSALLPTTGAGTATGNVTGDATGFNVTLHHPDTLTLSADSKTYIEGVNALNLNSSDTINILSTDYLLSKGATSNYLAGTTANFGYASGSTVGLGFTATSSTLTGVGIPAFSSGTIKSLVEDQSTHAITQKTLDRNTDLTSTLSIANGGTNITTYTTGDLLYASATNTLSKLAAGSNGNVLSLSGGVPVWSSPSGSVAGNNTDIQFNNSGAFGGTDSFTIASKLVSIYNSALFSPATVSATAQNALQLVNSAAATNADKVQVSPLLILKGAGWRSTATAASYDVYWGLRILPVTGAATITHKLQFMSTAGSNPNETTLTEKMNIDQSGNLSVANSVIVNTAGTLSSAGFTTTGSLAQFGSTSATGNTLLRSGPNSNAVEVFGATGDLLIQGAQTQTAADPSISFAVVRPNSFGLGGASNSAGGTTVTGVTGSRFTEYFKVGDQIDIVNGGTDETQTITAIASNTSMTTTAWTNLHSSGNYKAVGTTYVLTGAMNGRVGVGTNTPDASAQLDVSGTWGGVLFPRMTGVQAEAIASPADGLVIYCNNGNGTSITSVGFWGRSGGAWSKLN